MGTITFRPPRVGQCVYSSSRHSKTYARPAISGTRRRLFLETLEDRAMPSVNIDLPFSDNFTTATSPANNLDINWLRQAGNFSVNTTHGTATGANAVDLATVAGVIANNASVQATISLTTGKSAGLVADFSGGGIDQNYYLGGLIATATNGYEAYLDRVVNGVQTQLFAHAYTGSPDGTLLFQLYGPSLKLFLNGALIAYGDDITLVGGSVGMRGNQGAVLSSFSAASLSWVEETLPFSDDFATATSPANQLGSWWINQAGTFSVNTTQRTATGTGALDLATVTGVSAGNATVLAAISLTTGESAGLVVDFSGGGSDQNYYLGGVLATATNGYEAYLDRVVKGVKTQLFTQSYTGSPGGTLSFQLYGPSLKLFLNGALIAYGDDITLTGGGVGMWGNQGAVFTDFAAYILTMTSPTLPFSDNLTTVTTPANQLNDNWVNQAGNFSINTTQGTATGTGALDLATVTGVSASNATVQATISLTTGKSAGLVADFSGGGSDQNYYLGGVIATATNGHEAYLDRVVNGVQTQLFTQSYTGSPDGTLLFQLYGPSLKLFLNGALIAYGDSTTLAGGSVGMRASQGAVLSSFSAGFLTWATPTLPFSDNFTDVTSPANQLSNNWVNQAGTFSDNPTQRTATGIGALDLATVTGVSASNVLLQASISLTTGESAGLVADFSGGGSDQNYYLGGVIATATNGYEAYLDRVVNGVKTQLFTQSYTGSHNGTLSFELFGPSLQLYLNGTLIAYVDNTTLTGGSVGMWSNQGAVLSSFSAVSLTN
jgi:hypothetical protein